ncbi:uncharacterized protein BCR38DRAFT_434818 [Pseudomassariella vexata]|uniref:Uncharacterized protein n=1 Tax=Pseudomassariella vexata TaxID=1141098 RepID=A0A1Y2DYI9_9PEZI|nr:uncharacterized protein BCR38DRAFT_434818 [Pseudomassariella vexata]ORY64323.1 hypothetical protein BCR38DRAFT_434818 [Pseudomassariella vexata]
MHPSTPRTTIEATNKFQLATMPMPPGTIIVKISRISPCGTVRFAGATICPSSSRRRDPKPMAKLRLV